MRVVPDPADGERGDPRTPLSPPSLLTELLWRCLIEREREGVLARPGDKKEEIKDPVYP